ncbi:P-glycoprotein 3 [Aphelenchoides bicaudatus]|nr:P-glycoprotein 3 [Aphelenchoides bicaudatus]
MPPAMAIKPLAKNGLHKDIQLVPEDQEQDTLLNGQTTKSYVGFFQLMRYATKYDYFLLVTGVLLSAAYGTMPAFNTIAFRGLVNTLTIAQSQYNQNGTINLEEFTTDLSKDLLLYAFAATGSLLSGYFAMYFLYTLCERQIYEMRRRFFKTILNQPIAYFDETEVGALTQKVSTNFDRIRDGTTDKLVLVTSSTFGLVAGLVAAFYMSVDMGAVLLFIVPLVILNLLASGYFIRSPIKNESEAYGRAGSLAENVLSRIWTVLAFCGQSQEENRYAGHLADAHKNGLKKVFVNSFFTASFQAILFGTMSVFFWYGTILLVDGKVGPGDVMASFWAAVGGAIRFGSAIPHIAVIMTAKIAISEIVSIIDQKSSQVQTVKSGKLTTKVSGRIEFENVSFCYPSRPSTKALNNVSFVAEAGKKLALVGRSGSGKTSIVNLLMKHYEPNEGTIKVDGVPLNDLDTAYFRQNSIAIVPQQPVIFMATVEDNLKLGRNVTDEEMVDACKLANIHDVIKKLPLGYQTPITQGKLSGGEAQRLTIARALIANPTILIFDESLSYLDPQTAKQLQLALEKISVNRTIINITHRLPVKNADKIVVIDQSKVVEQGVHDELMQKQNGVYQHLVQIYKQQHEEDEHQTGIRRRPSSRHSKNSIQTQSCSQSLLADSEDEDDEQLDESKSTKRAASILKIIKFAKEEYNFLIPGLIATLLRGCSWPIFSIIYGRLFKLLSDVLISKSGVMTAQRFAEFLILATYAGLLTFLSGFLLGTGGEKFTKRLRYLLFGKMLSMDGEFYDNAKNSVGKLTTRLSSDTQSVAAAIDQRLADVLQGVVALFFGLCIAFFFDYRMAGLGCICPLCVIAIQITLSGALKRQIRRDAVANEETSRIAAETIAQIRVIHNMNSQHFFYKLYCDSAAQLYDKAKRRARIQGLSFGLLGSVIMVAAFMSDYLRARVSASLIFEILDTRPKINSSQQAQGLKPKINGNITFKNVSFTYPTYPNRVLNDLGFEVKKGQTIALVGPSGGGKSTIVQLIERFYDSSSGYIKFDDEIAYVPQQPTLFNLTIAENIAYGRPDASRDEIISAAKKAGAHDFIQSLPNDYDTVFGKDGALSGGQVQRISIARSFVLNASILVLDEINSSVDVENERIIQEALENEMKNRDKTCIVISHRLNSIKNCDLIGVVSDGRIVEIGSHEELLQKNGLYAKLCAKPAENTEE